MTALGQQEQSQTYFNLKWKLFLQFFLYMYTVQSKGDQAEKTGQFEGFSQFHCNWWISTLIKYSSFLGVKNARSISKIMETMVTEITLHLIQVVEITLHSIIRADNNVYKN